VIRFVGFPRGHNARRFVSAVKDAYARLRIRGRVVIVSEREYLPLYGLYPGSEGEWRVLADEGALGEAIRTGWVRPLLHELCHVKVYERLGCAPSALLGEPPCDALFEVFLDRQAPEGFLEFITDCVYMEVFPEYRHFFKPFGEYITTSLVRSFRRLTSGRVPTPVQFSNLFYCWWCHLLSSAYGEARPYGRMVARLRTVPRYSAVLSSFDACLSRFRWPFTKWQVREKVRRLHRVYLAYTRGERFIYGQNELDSDEDSRI